MALWNPRLKILIGTQAKCASTSLNNLLPRHGEWVCHYPIQPPPDPDDYPEAAVRIMQTRDPYDRFRSVFRYMWKQGGETLSPFCEDPSLFVRKACGGEYDNQFTRTQRHYADAMHATHWAKLEEGGVVAWLNDRYDLGLPPLPRNKVTGDGPPPFPWNELDDEAQILLDRWCAPDAERFGYDVRDVCRIDPR